MEIRKTMKMTWWYDSIWIRACWFCIITAYVQIYAHAHMCSHVTAWPTRVHGQECRMVSHNRPEMSGVRPCGAIVIVSIKSDIGYRVEIVASAYNLWLRNTKSLELHSHTTPPCLGVNQCSWVDVIALLSMTRNKTIHSICSHIKYLKLHEVNKWTHVQYTCRIYLKYHICDHSHSSRLHLRDSGPVHTDFKRQSYPCRCIRIAIPCMQEMCITSAGFIFKT